MQGAAAEELRRPLFDDLHHMKPAHDNGESYEMSTLTEEHLPDISEGWTIVRKRPKHNIFLSHSGAQKDFVEQLCVDLERTTLSPFFDKRYNSLPKGEEFAERIFTAAQECEVAVVVVTDEYFFRTKWPMLELVAVAEAPGCKLLPLFYGLTCKEFKKQKRQERWFKRWDRWAQEDNRVNVDAWKRALRKLGRVNGVVFSKALGEVSYREEVVNTLCRMMQSSLQDELSIVVDECIPVKGDYNSAQLPAGRFQRWSPVVLKWIPFTFPLHDNFEHDNFELFSRIRVFVQDLLQFTKDKGARERLLQDASIIKYFLSSVYFTETETDMLLSFKERDGSTLEEALQINYCSQVTGEDYEICTSHTLARIFQDHFGIKKNFQEELSYNKMYKTFTKNWKKPTDTENSKQKPGSSTKNKT